MIDGFRITILTSIFPNPRWAIMYLPKCNLHGFHVYKEVWSPIAGEQLKCCYERNNCYDCYAIVTTKHLLGRLANSTVGHLPREISRATRFFLLCAKVIDKNHRRSPLLQGWLQIAVQVTAETDLTERNKAILESINRLLFQVTKNPG